MTCTPDSAIGDLECSVQNRKLILRMKDSFEMRVEAWL